MYIVPLAPEKEPRVVLHHMGGYKRVFENFEDMCANLDLTWIKENVGLKYDEEIKIVTKRASGFKWDREARKIVWTNPEEYYWVYAEYVIRTEDGEKLAYDDLAPIYYRYRQRTRASRYINPRTRGAKRHCYGGYRKIRHANERRQAIAEEGEPPIRARRNKNNLPNPWNDAFFKRQRCWKHQSKRKRQYKPV